MDPRVNQLINEIVRIADQLKHDAQETAGYVQRGDKATALRNTNDSRDEVQDLVRKWQELTNLLNS